MKIYDIYIATPFIIRDYLKYNGSLHGISGLLYPLYTGTYCLDIIGDTYCIYLIRDKKMFTLFFGSENGTKQFLYMIKNKDELKNKYNVDEVYIKLDTKKRKTKLTFLDKISKETYVTYVV